MLHRYSENIENIRSFFNTEIDDLLPSVVQDRKVDTLVLNLRSFVGVTKELQKHDTTMSDVCALFDTVIEDYPKVSRRLSVEARIIEEPDSEIAVVKY